MDCTCLPEMPRRAFLAIVAGGLLAAPLAAEAQQAGKTYRLGWIGNAPVADPVWKTFIAALHGRGYVQGRNLVIERRYAEGRAERLPSFVSEFVNMRLDLMVITTTQGIQAAKAANTSMPIVMVNILDPERTGLIASLARPGGNITGISNQILDVQTKQFQLVKETLPRLSRLAVLWNPRNEGSALAWRESDQQAKALGMTAISGAVGSPDELESTLAAVAAQHPDGLVAHLNVLPYQKRIIEFSLSHKIPVFASERGWPAAGALLSYGPSQHEMVQRAAIYVDKILNGAKPADLPVEQPSTFELIINLKAAKALGLTIPPSLLQRADQVIE